MDLSRTRNAVGTDAFDEALLADLAMHQMELPLERCCQNGGWPGDVKSVTVRNLGLSDSLIQVIATVYFAEVLPGACRSTSYEQACTLQIGIDRKTGDGRVDSMGDDSLPD